MRQNQMTHTIADRFYVTHFGNLLKSFDTRLSIDVLLRLLLGQIKYQVEAIYRETVLNEHR